MTGPAADKAELKSLAAAGVFRLREVLLVAPPGRRGIRERPLPVAFEITGTKEPAP